MDHSVQAGHVFGTWIDYVPSLPSISIAIGTIETRMVCFIRYGFHETQCYWYIGCGFDIPLIKVGIGILIPNYSALRRRDRKSQIN